MFEFSIYETSAARYPFEEWLNGLADKRARAIIRVKLDYLRFGKMGNVKNLGDGVFEQRVDYGPGYRIYFGKSRNMLIVLLFGGSKKTQSHDIHLAKIYWKKHLEMEKK